MLGWVVHTSDSTSGLAVHYNQTLSCVISNLFLFRTQFHMSCKKGIFKYTWSRCTQVEWVMRVLGDQIIRAAASFMCITWHCTALPHH